ncbi:MAG: polysaccharide biosynthesis/export family protein [bacterium]
MRRQLPSTDMPATDTYNVGPSDVLEISVWGEPDLNKTVLVSSDGAINFPLLGKVLVAGLTIEETEEKITSLLGRDYLVNPQVNINIKEYNSQKVVALGEVQKPGSYVLTGPTSILELLSKAGGVTKNVGNRIMIFRADPDLFLDPYAITIDEETITKRKPIIIDVNRLLKDGSLSENSDIVAGDVVFVEAKEDADINEQRVYITGKVNKPGAYDYQNGLTALNLCIIAGGFDPSSAPNRSTIIRNTEGEQKIIKINLNNVIKGKSTDFILKPGDRLNIPESYW